jgi:hypothetical protein
VPRKTVPSSSKANELAHGSPLSATTRALALLKGVGGLLLDGRAMGGGWLAWLA